jgi:hypothetical protein
VPESVLESLRLAPMTLLAGLATGIATVAVHQGWEELALAIAATLAVLLAAPPGLGTRVPFALGYAGAVALASVPRPEGDFLIASDAAGYTVIGTACAVLLLSLATLREPSAPHRKSGT